jgi:hypothetical protein
MLVAYPVFLIMYPFWGVLDVFIDYIIIMGVFGVDFLSGPVRLGN